jgi:serine/threonine-protein kinase RsbW
VRSWRRPSSDVRFCLVFEREKLSVPVMRQVMGDTLRGVGVSEDCVADILLAVTEACTNVVLHADSAGAYEVTTTLGRAGCRVEVRDNGQGCRPGRRHRARTRELAEHGRGFAIMRSCVDGVTLRSVPGHGTSVVLDKRVHWVAPVSTPALNRLKTPDQVVCSVCA